MSNCATLLAVSNALGALFVVMLKAAGMELTAQIIATVLLQVATKSKTIGFAR